MQLRHVAQVHRAREPVAHFRCDRLEPLHRFGCTLRLQRSHEHLGVRQVARDFHVRNADRRQAVLGHRIAHQRAQLAAELGGNAVGAVEGLLRHQSVRWTSMRSKHSIWSPGCTSLYCFTPIPHSVPLRTSSTFSLKRRRDSSSPSKITVLSRSTRIGLLRLTTPSTTMPPATAPNLELRNTSPTSPVPMNHLRILNPRTPATPLLNWPLR